MATCGGERSRGMARNGRMWIAVCANYTMGTQGEPLQVYQLESAVMADFCATGRTETVWQRVRGTAAVKGQL